MLTIIIKTLAQILLIFVMFTAIILLIALAFAMLSGMNQIRQEDKFNKQIRDHRLREAKRDFDRMLRDLENQEPKL